MRFEVYLALCCISRKGYVGITQHGHTNRWLQHVCESKKGRSYGSAFHSAIRKYGEEAFVLILLDVVGTRDEAAALEVEYVAAYGTFSPGGYNMTTGGESGFKLGAQAKQRLRDKLLGHEVSPENLKKLWEGSTAYRNACLPGKPKRRALLQAIVRAFIRNPETGSDFVAAYKKLSIRAQEKRVALRRQKRTGPPRVISAETRLKISNTLKGRPLSVETKKNMSKSRKGRKLSDAHKEAISVAARLRGVPKEHMDLMNARKREIREARCRGLEAVSISK